MSSWPKWWDVVFHNRPRRRREAETLHNIRKGMDADAAVFDPGNHKPHNYFW